jgi:hypothetical protein
LRACLPNRTNLAVAGIAAVVAIAGSCVPGVAAALPAVATPSPLAIFVRTFQRLASYPVPAYVVDISTWHVLTADDEYHYTYRYAARTADGMENATPYPVPSKTLPTNARILPEYVGPLAWIVRPVRPATGTARPQIPADVPNLKNIASVFAYRPDYAIERLGIESIDAHTAYHLRLRPYGDELKHNLRELWVDVATFDLWKATFVGSCGPCRGPTTITSVFTPAAQGWVVARYSFQTRCGPLDPATCLFELQTDRIVFVPELPDWLFDEAAYMARAKAKEPDYLAGVLTAPK